MDEWEEFDSSAAATVSDDSTNAQKSLTASAKSLMYGKASDDEWIIHTAPPQTLPQYDSIYELARNSGMTVREWVQEDPAYALRLVENVCAEWNNVLTMAALTGSITMMGDDGIEHDYAVSKNQTKLIELRVREAKKQLDFVNELVLTSYRDDEQRKDALQRSMYQRALHGDAKLAIYLHDRIDGKPAETKTADLDYDNAYNIYMIIHTLFDKQLEVLNSGNGTKLVCCSRRAGKTHMLVAILLIECLRRSRTQTMYIGETMELSEALIDKAANDIVDACNLKDKRGRRFDWKHIDNGSSILVRGLSNTKDPDQIRGKAAKIIVIDEFFHLKSELLEYLQSQVLEPMQMDYANDYKFICAGTPPQIKGTYGEMAWKTWDVDHFSWTWRDNPHPVALEERQKFVDKVLHDKGLDWSTPFARREYNGEWAYDDDLLLYPEYYTYDPREAIPTLDVTRVLFGIDYGVGDNDTLIGIAWGDNEEDGGRGYEFFNCKFNRLDIKDRTISQLDYLQGRVKEAWRQALDYFLPYMSPREANKRILWDADDNDQHVTDHLNINVHLDHELIQLADGNTFDLADLSLNIANAHKTDKVLMYDKIADLLRTAGLLLIKDGKTAKECDSTVVKRGPNGEIYREVDSKVYHPDLLPAMRYALFNVIGV